MEIRPKESYSEPVLVAHELLRDITATSSGSQCIKEIDTGCVSG